MSGESETDADLWLCSIISLEKVAADRDCVPDHDSSGTSTGNHESENSIQITIEIFKART